MSINTKIMLKKIKDKSSKINIKFFKNPDKVKGPALVFFPLLENQLNCGLSGIVTFKADKKEKVSFESFKGTSFIDSIKSNSLEDDKNNYESYLNGNDHLVKFSGYVQNLKSDEIFQILLSSKDNLAKLKSIACDLGVFLEKESEIFSKISSKLNIESFDLIHSRLEKAKDIQWILEKEICDNVEKIEALLSGCLINEKNTEVFKKINTVLNSIDRLEVRGRDSAGISVMFVFEEEVYKKILSKLEEETLDKELSERTNGLILENRTISVRDFKKEDKNYVSFNITYKVAAEIGSLGDNIKFIRRSIRNDLILQIISSEYFSYNTVSAHTRWASVGAITVPNCHPVDNITSLDNKPSGIIHVSLNGDIDNYLELKEDYEKNFGSIPDEITTDTKIIPLLVETYVKRGHSVKDAFLMAVNDFEGSHAISMHTDLAPGKLFLAQRGSGQAVFIGIGENNYMAVSEVYGFVEETSRFIRIDGESVVEGKSGPVQGQIFILDQFSEGGLGGIEAMRYDSEPIEITDELVKETDIKTRDIDRQDFPHYFLKEISESPASVEKTLQNRWKVSEDGNLKIVLDDSNVPSELIEEIRDGKIKRIFYMGQGTAGIAAQVCADLMAYYLSDSSIFVSAVKSSELSGFQISESQSSDSMNDTIVVAISQSGTTTDTNRAVDMVKEKGARTLAIVNRRDSDLSFKADGVIYTSSGRDLEMSVASTKAFYSQIIAGSILGLYVSAITGKMCNKMVNDEIKELIKIPDVMKKILSMKDQIKDSAMEIAVKKTYWASVGSGPNKASADEIRIKLSELCYKTISSDYIEDKKHIDLSSEPLIIVCAAGTRPSVLGDIIKDTAIFNAHKATTVVITDEGEKGFDSYSKHIFKVPKIAEHLAPIANTLVGHIWGYYAALSINDGSRFMFKKREHFNKLLNSYAQQGLNIYEVILEKKFREDIASFYKEFREKRLKKEFPPIMGFNTASDLTLLLKYLSGRLPISDFEMDFSKKGTPVNMLDSFFECLGDSINCMARPVDAIKHQAKTVTVGTSRISESVEGELFEVLKMHNINISQIANNNVIVMKNLQAIISYIKGTVLYRIGGVNLLGEPDDNTTIEVLNKTGELEAIESRVENDNTLRGTKRIIVREGNVFIGKGKKDGRMTLVIPVISKDSPTSNVLENLVSLNVELKKDNEIPLFKKVKALGGKHERLRNLAQENNIKWDDSLLEKIPVNELFGHSAEKVVEDYLS